MNNNFFCEKKCSKRQKEQQRIDAEIHTVLREFDRQSEGRLAFEQLLIYVRAYTELLKPTPGIGSAGWVAPVFLIKRLRNLAAVQPHWIRPLHGWHPASQNLRLAFRSLAHHLLAYYPMPGFMDSVWDFKPGPKGYYHQTWFMRLGRGASFRELDLPLPLTRRMEHFLRFAPDYCSIPQALRYGEVRGMGGSKELAHEIVLGLLGQELEHPEFWRTVIGFLVRHPQMPLEQVNPVIDFIQANKFGVAQFHDQGVPTRVAPWPNFSMEGRTLKSMLRLTDEWHQKLGRTKLSACYSWPRSRFQGYSLIEKGEETDFKWSIEELLDSDALFAEGRAMRHCVYSYANLCRRRETTIWSLRLRVKDGEKRLATIEVNPLRRAIIQARAKCNARPGPRAVEIMRQWAAQEKLQVQVKLD